MLTFFLLGGRYLDHRTRAVARSAAQELAALEVPRALRVTAGRDRGTVAAAELAVGDIVRVVPGGRIPVDGIEIGGAVELDRSLLTGESLPVFAGPGGGQRRRGEPDRAADGAGLARRARTRRCTGWPTSWPMAETGPRQLHSLADKAAKLYAPGVHILALAAFGWMVISGWDVRMSLNIAAAVLIITCPCALGLAVPAVTTAASGRLFRKGC
jgi:Cu2+-exporting ATPase